MIIFEDFLKAPKNCSWKNALNNVDAKRVFNIIIKEKNISNMLFLSDCNIPALSAVVEEIETDFSNNKYESIDLNNNFHRQGIGCMVRCVLEQFGYFTNTDTKVIPKEFSHKYFKTAAIYKKSSGDYLQIGYQIIK